MLSIDQKKSIYVAVKSAFVVAGNSITVGHQYANEELTTFPRITLYYPDEGIEGQRAIGCIINQTGTKGQRSLAQLSINVFAKMPNTWNLNNNTLAGDITKQLREDIYANWNSLSSDAVRFDHMSSVRNVTAIEMAQGNLDRARLQFDVYLKYDTTW